MGFLLYGYMKQTRQDNFILKYMQNSLRWFNVNYAMQLHSSISLILVYQEHIGHSFNVHAYMHAIGYVQFFCHLIETSSWYSLQLLRLF